MLTAWYMSFQVLLAGEALPTVCTEDHRRPGPCMNVGRSGSGTSVPPCHRGRVVSQCEAWKQPNRGCCRRADRIYGGWEGS